MITLYLRTRIECAVHVALYVGARDNVHTKTNARGRCVFVLILCLHVHVRLQRAWM